MFRPSFKTKFIHQNINLRKTEVHINKNGTYPTFVYCKYIPLVIFPRGMHFIVIIF